MAKKYNQMPVQDLDSFKRELRHLKNRADELRAVAESMLGNSRDCGRQQEIILCALADASIDYDRKAQEFIIKFKENLNEIQSKN